jgi:hypothetical protein
MLYKKLNWLQDGDIRITQGYHGRFQNNLALDFDKKDLKAPEKCRIMRISKDRTNPYNSFVNIQVLGTNGTVFYQIVHFETNKIENQEFNKGEIMGYCTSNHYHIALNINKQWQSVLDYTKRDRRLVLVGSPWSTPYDQWSFYNDRSIAFIDNSKPKPPAPVQRTYTLKAQGTKRRFWRSEAIQQIINAGLLKGTWQQYDQEFNKLNPIPAGGYNAGQIIKLP